MLQSKKILITGAARGLGLDFASTICQHGGQVVIADIQYDLAQKAAHALQEQGYRAHAIPLDLRKAESIQQAADVAIDYLGGLDGLVNNGAITNSGGKTLQELSIEQWDSVMEVNVRGTWLMSVACISALRQSAAPAIVNLASDTALWGAPRLAAYVASKGAIISLTRSMARELGEYNITVNAVAPGLTMVEATEYVPIDRQHLYINQRAISREQVPQDVTGTVLFCLSDLARFMTGQVLTINGGFVMH